MNSLAYLISVTSIVYLAIFVLLMKNWRKNRAYSFYTLFIVAGFMWVTVGMLEVSSAAQKQLINDYLSKLDFIFATLMAFFVALFALHFPSKNKNVTFTKELILFAPIAFSIIIVLGGIVFTFDDNEPSYNLFWYFVYFLIIVAYFIGIAFVNFVVKKRKAAGIEKKQLSYLTWSYIITATIGLCFSVFYAFNTHFSPWFGISNIITLTFAFGSSYAMLRYRFMDVRVVVGKGLAYLLLLVVALIAYTIIVLSLRTTFENSWNAPAGWTAAVLVLITVAGFIPVKKGVEYMVNKLFKGRKSIDLAVAELKKDISEQSDAASLAKLLTAQVRRFLDVSEAHVYLGKPSEELVSYGNGGDRISRENDIVRYFQKYRDPIVREEIPHMLDEREGEFERDALQKVEKEMKKQKLSIAMPFVHEDGVFGLLTVGERENKEAFTVQDIQFLTKLRGEISFTLASALQYSYAMERIKRMQATGEL